MRPNLMGCSLVSAFVLCAIAEAISIRRDQSLCLSRPTACFPLAVAAIPSATISSDLQIAAPQQLCGRFRHSFKNAVVIIGPGESSCTLSQQVLRLISQGPSAVIVTLGDTNDCLVLQQFNISAVTAIGFACMSESIRRNVIDATSDYIDVQATIRTNEILAAEQECSECVCIASFLGGVCVGLAAASGVLGFVIWRQRKANSSNPHIELKSMQGVGTFNRHTLIHDTPPPPLADAQPLPLSNRSDVTAQFFEQRWRELGICASLELTLKRVPQERELEELFQKENIFCMASGTDSDGELKLYLYAAVDQGASCLFLVEVCVNPQKKLVAEFKSDRSSLVPLFKDVFKSTIHSFIDPTQTFTDI
eukprot:GILK01013005.1.p1 GENE.GILK01013005.1~~GILK01013005.1.p1  ORF type:complete len:364 (+),score=25.71 GILK01013005.1:84-1175(+)